MIYDPSHDDRLITDKTKDPVWLSVCYDPDEGDIIFFIGNTEEDVQNWFHCYLAERWQPDWGLFTGDYGTDIGVWMTTDDQLQWWFAKRRPSYHKPPDAPTNALLKWLRDEGDT